MLTFNIMLPVFMFSIISSYLVSVSDVHADDNIVAVVNGQKLTRDELSDLLINTFGNEGMDLLIKRTVVRQEASKQEVKVNQEEITKRIDDFIGAEIKRQIKKNGLKDEEDLKRELEKAGITIEQYRKNIAKSFRLSEGQVEAELLAEKIIKKTISITDEDLHEAYEEQYGEKILARQIVLRTKREAEKTLEKVKAGADFAALVKKESIDRNSASREGKMRPFGPHGIIGKAVANLKKGEISEIIKTDGGYHILKIEKRRPRSTKKFSETKDILKKYVTAVKVQERVSPWLLNLVESAEIVNNLLDK